MTSTSIRSGRPLLDTKGAADYLGLGVPTLNRCRQVGNGPAYSKFGSAVRYHPDDLDAYAESCRRTSTSEAEAKAA